MIDKSGSRPSDSDQRAGFGPNRPSGHPARHLDAGYSSPQSTGSDSIDIQELLGALWRGKWIIAVCALLAGLIGGYYAFQVAVPKYASTTRLALQIRQEQVVDIESVVSGVSTDASAISTELELIRSRALIEQLVDNLDLVNDAEFNSALRTPSPLSVAGIKRNLKRVIRGSTNKPASLPDIETQKQITVKSVARAISVSQYRDTFLFDISAITEGRDKSAAITNELARLYIDDQLKTKFSATEYAVNWLTERVTELELELEQKEGAIKQLQSETKLISAEALDALNVRAKDMRDRVTQATEAVETDQRRLAGIESAIENQRVGELVGIFNDPRLKSLRDDAENADGTARRQFFERAKSLLLAEQQSLNRRIVQLNSLQEAYDRLQEQVEAQSEDLTRLNQMIREAEATRTLYETFLARLKETSIQIGLQQADSRILTTALPGATVQPNRPRIIAMCMFIGAMTGMGLSLTAQFFRRGVRTREELESATNFAVLGQIPKFPIRKRQDLVEYLLKNPTSAASEAVRNLRTSIVLSDLDNPPKVIMSTSSVPGEGKTTVAISLAHNFSGLSKRVLLIEGDIRRRTLGEYFDSHGKLGMASVLSGDHSLSEVVHHFEPLGIDVLFGSKMNVSAADVFSSRKFASLLDEARDQYDYVIIDTPPLLVVPDGRLIGRNCDCVIYSVLWNQTPVSQITEGLLQLTSVNLPVTGLVLSRVDMNGMRRYGYGGKYGSYGYYSHKYYDAD